MENENLTLCAAVNTWSCFSSHLRKEEIRCLHLVLYFERVEKGSYLQNCVEDFAPEVPVRPKNATGVTYNCSWVTLQCPKGTLKKSPK